MGERERCNAIARNALLYDRSPPVPLQRPEALAEARRLVEIGFQFNDPEAEGPSHTSTIFEQESIGQVRILHSPGKPVNSFNTIFTYRVVQKNVS